MQKVRITVALASLTNPTGPSVSGVSGTPPSPARLDSQVSVLTASDDRRLMSELGCNLVGHIQEDAGKCGFFSTMPLYIVSCGINWET